MTSHTTAITNYQSNPGPGPSTSSGPPRDAPSRPPTPQHCPGTTGSVEKTLIFFFFFPSLYTHDPSLRSRPCFPKLCQCTISCIFEQETLVSGLSSPFRVRPIFFGAPIHLPQCHACMRGVDPSLEPLPPPLVPQHAPWPCLGAASGLRRWGRNPPHYPLATGSVGQTLIFFFFFIPPIYPRPFVEVTPLFSENLPMQNLKNRHCENVARGG